MDWFYLRQDSPQIKREVDIELVDKPFVKVSYLQIPVYSRKCASFSTINCNKKKTFAKTCHESVLLSH